MLTTEAQPSEEATQAAAKEAVSDLAAKLNDFLAQATREVAPGALVQPEPKPTSAPIEAVQTPVTTE
ncbi:hypothetical protein D3C76_1830270 [compost metagenome]